jgi:23S rRNA (pseudouridine1915-N3)-methyltransferase
VRLVTLAVGTPRHPGLADAIRDFEDRAARYFAFETIEVPSGSGRGRGPDRVRDDEADALIRRLPGDLTTCALTRGGRTLDSRALADWLGEMATYALPGAAFLIGGAFGLHDRALARCERRISLSRLTLPHEMARLVLAEQIYRAGTILRGEPYHKGCGA